MIIGNGLIARAFNSFESIGDFIVFASGVSNSSETLEASFLREKKLLQETIKNCKPHQSLIYFSTCSVEDNDLKNSKYVIHKLEMESLVSELQKFYIIRLSNVVGVTKNEHTITNFLYNCVKDEKPFTIWRNAYRNIIDVDDVFQIVNFIAIKTKFQNKITNVAVPFSTSILEIVQIFEKILDKKSKHSFNERGSYYKINVESILPFVSSLNINFDKTYIERVLRKYYGK